MSYTINYIKNNEKSLRLPTKDVVSPLYIGIKTDIDYMKRVMVENDGIGIASNQILFYDKSFIAIDLALALNKPNLGISVIINPKIVSCSKEMVDGLEACLSVPGKYGYVNRYNCVEVRGKDENWDDISINIPGLVSRVLQHEIDHLNGILYFDHLKDGYNSLLDLPIG